MEEKQVSPSCILYLNWKYIP